MTRLVTVADVERLDWGEGAMIVRSRRNVLLQGSLSAGAVTAVALVPGQAAEAATGKKTDEAVSAESLTAFVRDPRAGEISFFVGTDEVVVRDRDLAARLSRALNQARRP